MDGIGWYELVLDEIEWHGIVWNWIGIVENLPLKIVIDFPLGIIGDFSMQNVQQFPMQNHQ